MYILVIYTFFFFFLIKNKKGIYITGGQFLLFGRCAVWLAALFDRPTLALGWLGRSSVRIGLGAGERKGRSAARGFTGSCRRGVWVVFRDFGHKNKKTT